MSDLVSGRYGAQDPMWLIFGRPTNVVQSDIPARGNVWMSKLSTLSDGALAATEVGTVIAVPVQEGDVISKATFFIGATEGKEVEAGYTALYEGKKAGKLLVQSKSKKYTTQVEKEKVCVMEFEKTILVTNEIAPKGYLYVVLAFESPTGVAGVIPTMISYAVPKACQAEWFTGTPEAWAGTAGTGLKGTAEATLGTVTTKAAAPIVFLQ